MSRRSSIEWSSGFPSHVVRRLQPTFSVFFLLRQGGGLRAVPLSLFAAVGFVFFKPECLSCFAESLPRCFQQKVPLASLGVFLGSFVCRRCAVDVS